MFPLAIEGSIPIGTKTEADVHALGQRICAEIKSLDIEGEIHGAVVSFKNDRQRYWKPFADRSIDMIDSGTIAIDNGRLCYSLSTTYFVVIGATLLALPLVFCLVLRTLIGVVVVLGVGLFGFFYTYLSVSIRVRRVLRRAVAAPLLASPPGGGEEYEVRPPSA